MQGGCRGSAGPGSGGCRGALTAGCCSRRGGGSGALVHHSRGPADNKSRSPGRCGAQPGMPGPVVLPRLPPSHHHPRGCSSLRDPPLQVFSGSVPPQNPSGAPQQPHCGEAGGLGVYSCARRGDPRVGKWHIHAHGPGRCRVPRPCLRHGRGTRHLPGRMLYWGPWGQGWGKEGAGWEQELLRVTLGTYLAGQRSLHPWRRIFGCTNALPHCAAQAARAALAESPPPPLHRGLIPIACHGSVSCSGSGCSRQRAAWAPSLVA